MDSVTIIDHGPGEEAFHAMLAAISSLPAAAQAAQHVKFDAVFDERLADLFFVRWEPAGPAGQPARSTLHPSKGFLEAIAAVRAGDLDWDVKLPHWAG